MWLKHIVESRKIIVTGLRNNSQIAKSPNKMANNSYKEAIETLNKLQSNAEYIKHVKIKNNQENNMSEMAKFLNRTGISHRQLDTLPIIHVAGTNGKGTTCFYCESILRHHGYRTGFYSSPHLLEVRERIRLNGQPISRAQFTDHFWTVYNQLDKEKSAPYDMPLYFRFLTIMALHVFLNEPVDVVILEVGIGGEYDCTNIVRKTIVAGITPLDIDHTTLLGNSLESIAWNKAGIMKPGARVFTVNQPEIAMKILRERSIERQCTLHIIEDIYTDNDTKIPKQIQKTNASLSLYISEAFTKAIKGQFNRELAKRAIHSANWPGRYETILSGNLRLFLDGAHTVQSMQVCSDWFASLTANSDKKKVLVFNVTGDRDPESLLKILIKCGFDRVLFVPNVSGHKDILDMEDQIQPIKRQLERCHIISEIWQRLNSNSTIKVLESIAQCLEYLNEFETQFDVLVTGSIHLIGAAMSVLDPTLGGNL